MAAVIVTSSVGDWVSSLFSSQTDIDKKNSKPSGSCSVDVLIRFRANS